eukprot:GDKI01006144.1.p1 GENE.GDKI01006144.1~~GDKI01006144.1.p1  ORF type:complete len:273 (-),score=65.40 GDKI01006144.1:18-836(-)
MRFGQVVVGPAGCGKSTFCALLQQHCEASKRNVRCVNLDPAAEHFSYPCDIDIRDLISVDDVMEETELGPNGGLIYAMEYIGDNLDWLKEQLDQFSGDDEYFLFDCPGQIELYSHLPVMRLIIDTIQGWDIRLCGVCCIDVSFITDSSKFLSGSLMALSAMVQLELPHVNVLTKCDLMNDNPEIDRILDQDPDQLVGELHDALPPKFKSLNQAMGQLLSEFAMVSFLTLNPKDEDSVGHVLNQIDYTIQYGEDLEPKDDFDFGDGGGDQDDE